MSSARDPEHRAKLQEGWRRWWEALKADPDAMERWRAGQRRARRITARRRRIAERG